MKFIEKHALTNWILEWDCTEYGIENPKSNIDGSDLPKKIQWLELFTNLTNSITKEDGWMREFVNGDKKINI